MPLVLMCLPRSCGEPRNKVASDCWQMAIMGVPGDPPISSYIDGCFDGREGPPIK
jgi:hypothetical protein